MDEEKRERTLKRLVTLMRVATDERSPEGERAAARNRCDAITKRWEFTFDELRAAIAADMRAQQPSRPAPPPPRPSRQTIRHPFAEVRIVFNEFGGNFETGTIFYG
jgi:hypothetical protein